MCLILFAVRAHPDYPLVIAANRDENYRRPTAAAAYWQDHPQVLAGRDLEALGTWLGVTRAGRFAALTNFRDAFERKTEAPSRGRLVSDFLTSAIDPQAYLDQIAPSAGRYNGFNLLVGDAAGVHSFSSRGSSSQRLLPGVYGLSNHLLDTPWPKVAAGKKRLAGILQDGVSAEPLFELLDDRREAPDDLLPDTGVGLARERVLSPALIAAPEYGTRASTVVLFHRAGAVEFSERGVMPGGVHGETLRYRFNLPAASAS
jgi:uncharacterized protein with NRDE domain